MKKFVRKIILSAFALTLAVVTLSTTTYAWYVSNTKAKVNGVNGAAATAEGGMLLVAKDVENKPGDWTAAIESLEAVKKVDLKPVTKVLEKDIAEGSLFANNGLVTGDWVDATGKKVNAEDYYIEYKFWILTTKADVNSIGVTGVVTNTTSVGSTPQTVYSKVGLPNTVTEIGKTFTADAVYALAVEIFTEEANEDNNGLKQEDNSPKSEGSGMLLTALTDGGYSTKEGMVTGGDANQYYKSLLGKAPFGTNKDDGTSRTPSESGRIKSLNVVSNIGKRVTIRIWLDGASAGCWDSCVGQNFKLDLTFTTEAAS